MFDFIPDSWRQALGHLHEAIHHSLDRWLHDERSEPEARPGALVPRPAAEVVRRDASRLPLLFADRGPVVDIDETDDDLIVSAELPGLECDDFRVEVSGERLVIRGEKNKLQSARNGVLPIPNVAMTPLHAPSRCPVKSIRTRSSHATRMGCCALRCRRPNRRSLDA